MYEKLVIGLPPVFRNPGSFQGAECASKAQKPHLESVYTGRYTLNDVVSAICKARMRAINSACVRVRRPPKQWHHLRPLRILQYGGHLTGASCHL